MDLFSSRIPRLKHGIIFSYKDCITIVDINYTIMKKIAMTICGIAFISVIGLAQRVDSTNNRNGSTEINDNSAQDSSLNQPTNPPTIDGAPRTQDPTTSPTEQPQLQPQPPTQSQPEVQPQPLQTQPQVPTQNQPTLNPNNPAPQNQSSEPVQPTQPTQPVTPTRTDPANNGTTPPR